MSFVYDKLISRYIGIKDLFMTEQRRNKYKVSDGTWVVTTQAGFKKLMKGIVSNYDDFTGYPECYPSVVTYTVNYRGYFNVDFKCVPLTKYKENLKRNLIKLEIIESEIRIREGVM